jgi:hypothetical protein
MINGKEPTMEVRVGNTVEERKVDYVDTKTGQLFPELKPGEQVMIMLGTFMPYILRTQE